MKYQNTSAGMYDTKCDRKWIKFIIESPFLKISPSTIDKYIENILALLSPQPPLQPDILPSALSQPLKICQAILFSTKATHFLPDHFV